MAVRRARFDLLLIDLGLPDVPGLEVIRRLRAQNILTTFMAITGFANAKVVVEAMKAGAVTVLEKPLDLDSLIDAVNLVLWPASDDAAFTRPAEPARESSGHCLSARLAVPAFEPRSAVERWALFVLKAAYAEADPKTIGLWARLVGVSSSVLRESCRIVHVCPHDARDFARVLRAIYRSGRKWRPEIDIDVADARTLRRLERRAGLSGLSNVAAPTVKEFLGCQHLIPSDNPVLLAVGRMLNVHD